MSLVGEGAELMICPTPRTLKDLHRQVAKIVHPSGPIALATAAATTSKLGTVKMATAVSSLGLSVSDPPTQSEVQDIADKLDLLLAHLRTAGLLHP